LKTVNQYLGNTSSSKPDSGVGSQQPPKSADSAGAIKSSLGDNPRMQAIIPEFIDGLPDQVRMMTDLLERNDLAALQKVIHQLRGAAGGYGFEPITEPATIAEESIKVGKAYESIAAEIKSLIEVIRRIDGYDESKSHVTDEVPAK
jgi:HPt (histidine-containing phosphotransfer) domain-containing protein